MNTTKRKIAWVSVALVAFVAGGAGLYRLGAHNARSAQPGIAAVPKDGVPKKPLYWHDPMVPGQRFDKPGKSPFMDMQLVPVYAEGDSGAGTISINPRVQQNLGLRTAPVLSGRLASSLSAVGNVAYNERALVVVQARSTGFVEKLLVRAQLDKVQKGQALAELYLPDWIAAQEEYFTARRLQQQGVEGLVEGARQRMRLAGMGDQQIRAVEAIGKVQPRVIVRAPASGIVTELAVREGMAVSIGSPLFRITGLDSVWVYADVPEALAGQLRLRDAVEARATAIAGTVFNGKVNAILPEVSASTRTLKARIELRNPAGNLLPGMFVTLNFHGAKLAETLLVPSEAVIQTGRRSIVMVVQADGKFHPAAVETGAEANGQTEILKGLALGQRVVVSGQFLVDSEASLKGVLARMGEVEEPTAAGPAQQLHHGSGTVEAMSGDEVTLSHGPIASLQWGAMTMPFKLASSAGAAKVKVGDQVTFAVRKRADGAFEITSIQASPHVPGDRKP